MMLNTVSQGIPDLLERLG